LILLFDLDGTLTDPREGIVRSTLHAFERLGLEAPHGDVVATFIGPPLRGMFSVLLSDAAPHRVEEAVRHYRERYSDIGIFETRTYDGVPEALERVRPIASRVYLATSKPWVFAERILHHLGLASFFDGVYGPELDGRFDDKGELIRRMLEREGFRAGDAVMIGDRAADATAALVNEVEPVGVLWGYGSEEELRSAGVRTLFGTPGMLARALEARARARGGGVAGGSAAAEEPSGTAVGGAGEDGTAGAGSDLSRAPPPREEVRHQSGGEGSGLASMPYLRRIRSMVGHELLLLPSVTVLLFDADDRLLLLKHTKTGRWVAPGGMVEPDESPEQAAVREMREETGCDVSLVDTVGVFGGPKFRVRYDNGDEVAYVMTVYTARVERGVPSGSSDESEEMKFVSEREISALDTAEWLKEVLSHVGWGKSRAT
jgi:phosphoglycolate phosphatase